MKVLKLAGLALLALLLIIQLFHPQKNISSEATPKHIGTSYKIPENIQAILVKACYDCHSNNTVYPWYNNIQPVAWWLNDHVVSGKRHLNFDEFTAYSIARQYRKIQQCAEEVKNKNMPLLSYTWVHKNAILTQEEKLAFINWCSAVRDSIKAKYPADSLVMPKRK
ncbi:MAG: heme-binding domain-containing protein [Sphingobacteriia bacterium]|nr:heme-binding domain-containing protein [Sphingobacteriia bacterium]